jgi:hypothetical protein
MDAWIGDMGAVFITRPAGESVSDRLGVELGQRDAVLSRPGVSSRIRFSAAPIGAGGGFWIANACKKLASWNLLEACNQTNRHGFGACHDIDDRTMCSTLW